MSEVPKALLSLLMFKRDVGAALRTQILERDRHVCHYCGRWATEVDHYHPFSRGGLTIESNLVAACPYCNRSKGDRTEQEWRQARAVEYLSKAIAQRRTRRGRISAVVHQSQARRASNQDGALALAALMRRAPS